MKILTINILANEPESFEFKYSDIIKQTKVLDKFELRIIRIEKSKSETLITALEQTDSLYVAFYDEENILDYAEIVHLVDRLSTCDASIISQRMSFENIRHKNEFLTGAMRKNNLYFNRYIFKTELIKQIEFTEKERPFFEEKVILEMTKDVESILLFGDTTLSTEAAMELNVNLYPKQFMYEWYIPFFEDFILPYINKNNLTKTQQRYIVYFIMLRFYLNTNERNKHVIENGDVEYFFQLVKKVLTYIDDEYI